MKNYKNLALALAAAAAATLARSDVVISEIMYHPESDLRGDEFVELHNTGGTTVSLNGWCFEGIELCFGAADSIAPNARLVVAGDAAQFLATYGFAAHAVFLKELDNDGERVALLDNIQDVEDEVAFDDEPPWPVLPDGLGPSLEVIAVDQDNSTPRNWRACTAPAGHTAGAANSVAAAALPPWIESPQAPPYPAAGAPIAVTAQVLGATTVELHYRMGFGTVEQTLSMLDNGVPPDSAIDGVYTAALPAQPVNTMVRFRIVASGATGTMSHPRDDDTVSYDGTVVTDSVSTALPLLHWFIDPADYDAAVCYCGDECQDPECHVMTDLTEPAWLYFNGKFYDGVTTRVRGQSSRTWPKKHWKFTLPQGHNFEAPGLLENDVDQFNLQAGYADKTYMRELLAWETLADAGVPASQVFHTRVHLNGEFYGLYVTMEDHDADWLRRNDLKTTASRYKAFSDMRMFVSPDALDLYKQFYEPQGAEDHLDLQAFVTGIHNPNPAARRQFLIDNVAVPQVLNYMAAQILFHNNDHLNKNYFVYRDSGGTNRWTMLPWDMDLTFGKNYYGPEHNVFDDIMWADVDQLAGKPGYISPSHPLFGDTNHRKVDDILNYFIDAMLREPEFRAMFLRRLRTLMDEQLVEGRYEARIAELEALIGPEAALDRLQPWGQPGAPQDLAEAIEVLEHDYLDKRRVHLFETHSVCFAEIPPAQSPFPTVLIHEIMYWPPSAPEAEYIELYNPSPTESVDLSGWRIDGVALTIPPGTVILPQGYVLFVEKDSVFRATYGGGKPVAAEFPGNLKDAGEALVLRNPHGAVVSSVAFEPTAPWPTAAAGGGSSLELRDPAQPTTLVANWAAGSPPTPGAANGSASIVPALPRLYINEVLSNNVSVQQDNALEYDPWIEIYNASTQAIDLGTVNGGTYLSSSLGVPLDWAIPDGTTVCGGCRVLVWVDGDTAQTVAGYPHASFSLSVLGGFIGLFAADGTLIDHMNYPALPADHAWGRLPDGSADTRILSIVTPTGPNDAPSSLLVLNEYNAVASSKKLDNGNTDSYWGRINGNGGDWFELLVIQDHLNVQGWQLEITDNTGLAGETLTTLTFDDNDPALSDLRAGTLVTVSEQLPDDLGFDPQFDDWWINVQAAAGAPGTYITPTNFPVSHQNWQLTIKNAAGVTMFGPAGEGVQPLSGVNDQEVLKLEEDPGPYLTPFANYNDGTSSTFGSANLYSAGSLVQDLAALREIGSQGTCTVPDVDGDGTCDQQDNCPTLYNPTQADADGDGSGDACDACPADVFDDADDDGRCANLDNCPFVTNPTQADGDSDLVGDLCDNCASTSNANQADADGDNLGDVCDACPDDPLNDADSDGVCHAADNCPDDPNPTQANGDGDLLGDDCDLCPADPKNDQDLDGYCAGAGSPPKLSNDNCPVWPNPSQSDTDLGGGDGVGDICDNCPSVANASQSDVDDDGTGDACDSDADGDGILVPPDNCPLAFNPDQLDTNGNGSGDACDTDDDSDTILDGSDNCPRNSNVLQNDGDLDGFGNVCDCASTDASLAAVPLQFGDTLRLDRAAGGTLRWTRAYQGHITNVFRGTLPGGAAWAYNETCLAANVPAQQLVDAATPAAGALYYYLLAGVNGCGTGPAGTGTLGYDVTVDPAGTYIEAENFTTQIEVGGTAFFTVENVQPGFSGVGYLRANGGGNDAVPMHEGRGYPLNFPAPGTYTVWIRSYADTNGQDSIFVGLNGTWTGALRVTTLDQWVWGNSVQIGSNLINVPSAGLHTLNVFLRESNHFLDGLFLSATGATPSGTLPPTGTCPHPSGPEDRDTDADGRNDKVDNCPQSPNTTQTDSDDDFVGDACDNCPTNANSGQENNDGDAQGDACDADDDGDGVLDGSDGCPFAADPGQADADDDGIGDACDPCTDTDGDGLGDPGFVANRCLPDSFPDDIENDTDGDGVSNPLDNCPEAPNADQDDADADGFGDACDACPDDPDDDVDGDGLCAGQCGPLDFHAVDLASGKETVLVAQGSSTRYLANASDPFVGEEWVLVGFNDAGWATGTFGLGYEASSGAEDLIQTAVPVGTLSVYTRTTFQISDLGDVEDLQLGADFDDGFAVWLNGVRIYKSPQLPSGTLEWNAAPTVHESSNASEPDYGAAIDLSDAIPLLQQGTNVLAIGVWNHQPYVPPSDDLVLVPRLSINRTPTMSYLANTAAPPAGTDGIWFTPAFDDSGWSGGRYTVGYDVGSPPNALGMLDTHVPFGSTSVYTRARFYIDNVDLIDEVMFAADYDDGYVMWINGTEVVRSESMPAGSPLWNTNAGPHESSNGTAPDLDPALSVTQSALPLLQSGENVIAIGVWNDSASSSDLVLHPELSLTTFGVDNCGFVYNPNQLDGDLDGVGDACDNCPTDFNSQQTDSDGNGTGDACEPGSLVAPPDKPTAAGERWAPRSLREQRRR